MRDALEHRLLVVSNDDSGQLKSEIMQLSNHPIRVIPPDGDVDSALTEIASVIIDSEIGITAGNRLVTLIKTTHPSMPLIWRTTGQEEASEFGRWKPDVVVQGPISKELWGAEVQPVLREHFCPPQLLDALGVICPQILLTTFETESEVSQQFVKASRNTLQPITALLPLTGDKVSGRVLVSTNIELLNTLHIRLFPELEDPGIAELEDIAGEISNQIGGLLKQFLHQYNCNVLSGVPVLLQGKRFSIRQMTEFPSIVTELLIDNEKMYIELSLDRLDVDSFGKQVRVKYERAGSVSFL